MFFFTCNLDKNFLPEESLELLRKVFFKNILRNTCMIKIFCDLLFGRMQKCIRIQK
jgi:hypothetical protein